MTLCSLVFQNWVRFGGVGPMNVCLPVLYELLLYLCVSKQVSGAPHLLSAYSVGNQQDAPLLVCFVEASRTPLFLSAFSIGVSGMLLFLLVLRRWDTISSCIWVFHINDFFHKRQKSRFYPD